MSEVMIKALNSDCINHIAAGEVIERPASIVKELVENSLDAKASQIEIRILNGGKTFLEVSDNGSGMSLENLKLCFLRHTTSKLSEITELQTLKSNGFRGEALSSITAVSYTEILSRDESLKHAHLLEIKGGSIINQSEAARNQGTTIRVQNLFFNTPVRKKFLASDQAETNRIVDICTRLFLANPQVGFSLFQDRRELLNCRPGDLDQRIAELLGSTYLRESTDLFREDNQWIMQGYISTAKPKLRKKQYFFINGRPFKDPVISRAISKATESVFPNKQASTVLFLEIPQNEVDINVHPSKQEVRFSRSEQVFSFIYHGIKNALQPEFAKTPAFLSANSSEKEIPIYSNGKSSFLNHKTISEQDENDLVQVQDLFAIPEPEKMISLPSINQTEKAESIQKFSSERFLQIDQSYIVCETASGILLIDQHRAHRRILFEQALHCLKNDEQLNTQQLLFPEQLEFSREEFLLMEQHLKEFNQLGFDLEAFGKDCMNLRGIPVFMKDSQAAEAIQHSLATLKEDLGVQDELFEKMAIAWSKGTAIARKTLLSTEEMSNLVSELFLTQNPQVDAMGKSIIFRFPFEEIHKQFAR